MHSAATQPALEHLSDQQPDYHKQWYEHNADAQHQQQRFSEMEHQMTAEDMVMHSASQLQNPREYALDPSLGGVGNQHAMAYAHDGVYKHENGRRSLPGDGYGTSFVEDDSPMLEDVSIEQDDGDSLAGVTGGPKKMPKSSAANELEMRQLFHSNKHRTLPDVAIELHGNERGPQSERIRQVFAMLW
jgi:regulatory factor X